MKKNILSFLLTASITVTSFSQSSYQKDFNYFWQTINDNFAYFGKQPVNWETAKTMYGRMADTCTSRNSLVYIFELALNELYNGHCFLNTNTPSSNRLIPSGADMKAVYTNGKLVIAELRPGFNAELCGLRKGMEILLINDMSVATAMGKFFPHPAGKPTQAMMDYAANMALAGRHDQPRKITVNTGDGSKDYYPDAVPNKTETGFETLLETKKLAGNAGYIRINNSLGNDELIKAFDLALDSMMNTSSLILDLRETPGGGTTTIARAIMGRFIDKEMPYQKHIYTAEEKETGIRRSTLELVSPRGITYRKPLTILVSYWTASMGEGMAIGFDAMKRAKVVGTPMAGLLGEIYTFETPELKIPFSFPTVQLQTVTGKPREEFKPSPLQPEQEKLVRQAMQQMKSL